MSVASAALLASAFLHALWNALLKRERDPEVAVAGVLSAALVVAAAVTATGSHPAFASRAALGWALGAGACEGVYFVTLAGALARAEYGIVYTVARGGSMVLVWPASLLLLQEPVRPRGLLGACVIAIGLALAAAGRRRPPAARAGLAYAVACATSIAGYHLCYDRALHAGAREAPLFALALATALPFVLLSLRARGTLAAAASPGWRGALRWGAGGVICTASFLIFLFGLSRSGPAIALTLRNTSIVFAQALALGIGERPGPRQVAGAVFVVAGAALVAAP